MRHGGTAPNRGFILYARSGSSPLRLRTIREEDVVDRKSLALGTPEGESPFLVRVATVASFRQPASLS